MPTTRSQQAAILEVLRMWGLSQYLPKFFSPDGLALIAHLCNAGAKFFDQELYDLKPALIELAAAMHGHAWQNENVIYFETSVGQISFHVFDGEGDLLPPSNGRKWAGDWMQDIAYEMAILYLCDCDIEAHSLARLVGGMQKCYID